MSVDQYKDKELIGASEYAVNPIYTGTIRERDVNVYDLECLTKATYPDGVPFRLQ